MSHGEDKVDLERRAEELESEAERITKEETPRQSGDEGERSTKERFDDALSAPLEKLRKIAGN